MNNYQNYQTGYIISEVKPDTIEICANLYKTKSYIKLGNLIIHNTHNFNWFHRKMFKLFFGFEIENVENGE